MDDAHDERGTVDGTVGTTRRRLDRRHVLETTAGGAAGLSLAGCLETAGSIVGSDDVEPVTIGVLAPNPDSDSTGRSIVQGARIAVDELKNGAGINGRDVGTGVGDTNSSPRETRRQYQRLVLEEGADVTVDISASEALVGLMDDIAEQQTLHLTAGSATTASQRVNEEYEKYKYHVRVGPVNGADLAQGQIDFLTEKGVDGGWNSSPCSPKTTAGPRDCGRSTGAASATSISTGPVVSDSLLRRRFSVSDPSRVHRYQSPFDTLTQTLCE